MTSSPAETRLTQALPNVIVPGGVVAGVFAQELQAALPWFTLEAAAGSVNDILARRHTEQVKPGGPTTPELDGLGLPKGRFQDLVESFVQPHAGKPTESESLIHIYANLRAQRDLHVALTEHVFLPGGRFEQAIAQELAKQVPDAPAEAVQKIAAAFVSVRRDRSQSVTVAMAEGGPVEQQAIETAYRLRRAGDAALMQPKGAPAQPASPRDRLGEDIAFGLQQTLACWGTDFIDPYVGKWFQDKFKDHHHHSTMAHTWGGEIVGDTAALFAFLGIRQLAPGVIEGMKAAVRTGGDGVLERMGKKSLRGWAQEHGVAEDSDAYRAHLEQWKDFQADNVAKSTVISASSVVLNVGAQKAMGNTHTLPVIAGSKVVGAAITMGAMLGLRFTIPQTTRALDDELSKKYFTPLIRKTQRLFGAKETATSAPEDSTHAARLESTQQSTPLAV